VLLNLVRAEAGRGQLRAVPVFAKKDARKLGVVYRQKGCRSPAAIEFLKLLEECLDRD